MIEATREPGSVDLQEVLCRVLEDFAYLTALPSEAGAMELPVCFRAQLPAGSGWLVLRGSKELARQLADASTGGSGDGLDEDAFMELCNLATSHLVSRHWSHRQKNWKAFVPAPGLPDGRLESRVLLDVEGLPIEASFWKPA